MTDNPLPTTANLDACEQEPLAFSGHIQDVGALMATSTGSTMLSHASDNLRRWFDLPAGNGKLDLQVLFSDDCNYFVHRRKSLSERGHFLIANVLSNRGIEGDLILSEHGDYNLYEFEAHETPPAGESAPGADSGALTVTFDDKTLPDDLPIEALMRDIHELSAYHKVMLYHFLPDGSGEVVAELNERRLDSYQGLRFPASDIPRIARNLYIDNPFRLIFDTGGKQSAVLGLPAQNLPGRPEELDLSHSTLRSVSPVHIEYLHNMGVRSSASFPVVVMGRLWGLIALHAVEPTTLSVATRIKIRRLIDRRLVRRLMDAQITEEHRRFNASVDLLRQSAAALAALLSSEFGAEGFTPPPALFALIQADALALRMNQTVIYRDAQLSDEEVHSIANIGRRQAMRGQFSTDTLSPFLTQDDDFRQRASGVLYCSSGEGSRGARLEILWLRGEQSQSVSWAGKPEKLQREVDGKVRISPRQSFASWQAKTSGQAPAWKSSDLLIASKLLVQIVTPRRSSTAAADP